MAKKDLTPPEKEEKKKKRKEQKEANEQKETVLIDSKDQTFIDKEGNHVKLMDFIHPEEVWEIESKRSTDTTITIVKRHFILYEGIKRLARESGIFYFDKVPVYTPTIENKDLYGFDVTVYCSSGMDGMPDLNGFRECLHGFFKTSMLGEANNSNTKRLSDKYKGLTAEKRGYVRAVINHLGLRNIYGEDELEEEQSDNEGRSVDITNIARDEFEELAPVVNDIFNSDTKEKLEIKMNLIASEANKYSMAQLAFLRKICSNKLSELEPKKF
jgi:hypothetical protein